MSNDIKNDLINWKAEQLSDDSPVYNSKDLINALNSVMPSLGSVILTTNNHILSKQEDWDSITMNTLNMFTTLANSGLPASDFPNNSGILLVLGYTSYNIYIAISGEAVYYRLGDADWNKLLTSASINDLNGSVTTLTSNLSKLSDQQTTLNSLFNTFKDDTTKQLDTLNTQSTSQAKMLEDINNQLVKLNETYNQVNRLNNVAKNLALTDIDGGIKDIFVDELNKYNSAIDTGLFNLVFATDYHYDIATTYNQFTGTTAPVNYQEMWQSELRKMLNIQMIDKADGVVFGGDMIDQPAMAKNHGSTKEAIKELKDVFSLIGTSIKIPSFIIKGNHDNNNNLGAADLVYDNVINNKVWSSNYAKYIPDWGEVRDGDSNYFYKDFDDKKVRVIGLDTYDLPETMLNGSLQFNRFKQSGLQQAQLDWLANKALATDYTVIITLHHQVNTIFNNDSGCINHDILKQIITDFVAGGVTDKTLTGTNTSVPVTLKYSFKNKGNLAVVLSGHFHLDFVKKVDNVNYVITRCASITGDVVDKTDRWAHYNVDAQEDAWDLVSLDTNKRTLTFKRFGAGNDDKEYATRTMSY